MPWNFHYYGKTRLSQDLNLKPHFPIDKDRDFRRYQNSKKICMRVSLRSVIQKHNIMRIQFDELTGMPVTDFAGEHPWRLKAITFFDPNFSTSQEIVDLLDFLDTFSGNHVDIQLTGFSQDPPSNVSSGALLEVRVGTTRRFYSAETLRKDVEELESCTSWRFSGEIDVILLNEKRWWSSAGSGVTRDYKNAMVLNIYRMLKDKIITSYSAFFMEVIRFAKDYEGDNPAWDLSDTKLWMELKASLFEAFKKYLGFRKFQIKVENYAIRDISNRLK